jgi:hypothetical protein
MDHSFITMSRKHRRQRPPPLPPRPPRATPIPPAPIDRSNPPPTHPSRPVNEKLPGFIPKQRRKCYPSSRRGIIYFWSLWPILAIILGVVLAIVIITTKRRSSKREDATPAGDGGHPLPISEGGVDIGRPGDIARFGNGSTDHFVLQVNRSIAVTRLDPIVNPGAIGSHVHRFYGPSHITQNRTSATDIQSLANCTVLPVQDDKSAYWVAQLYYRHANGTFSLVPIRHHAVYYFQKAPTGDTIYPFPDNYNLVAGNPYRRTINESRM